MTNNFWSYIQRYSNVVSKSKEAREYYKHHKLVKHNKGSTEKDVVKSFNRMFYSMLKRRIERIEAGRYPFYVSNAA